MLPTWFKEYLSFHRSERRGIIVLVALVVLLIGFNMYQRFFWKGDWQELSLQHGEAIFEFKNRIDTSTFVVDERQPWMPQKRALFQFDPNTLDSTGWVNLGFSPKQAASIVKYRESGAVFRKPEDVKKLFVVDDTRYQELEPYISIGPINSELARASTFERPKWEKPIREIAQIELNNADSTVLVELRGIGGSYAKRIIKYRELLGGYVSKEQLMEVYGMDSVRYAGFVDQVLVDSTRRILIDINTIEAKDLMRHPYIDKNQAVAIVNYRNQHGRFRTVDELKKIHLVTAETYRKIAPYLQVP